MFREIMRGKLFKSALFALAAALIITAVCALNSFDKAELVSTSGRTFEMAQVTEIIEDNLQEDGNRYGNQRVMLYIKSGALKGQTVEATSPNGTLFGAACRKGMPVIAIVSVSGNSSVVTVYSRDRTIPIICFVLIFILSLWLVGGKKGLNVCNGIQILCCIKAANPKAFLPRLFKT